MCMVRMHIQRYFMLYSDTLKDIFVKIYVHIAATPRKGRKTVAESVTSAQNTTLFNSE